jgi:hypothetical protein
MTAFDEDQAEIWWVEPQAGDICWCWTPHEIEPPRPGPKRHPSLIYRVTGTADLKRFKVLIAPGTSQKTDRLYGGEFCIGNDEDGNALKVAGLYKPTKFQLNRLVWLPYSSDFFGIPDWIPGARSPKIGSLDTSIPSVRRKLESAKKIVGR